jgi:hypothetical protein
MRFAPTRIKTGGLPMAERALLPLTPARNRVPLHVARG